MKTVTHSIIDPSALAFAADLLYAHELIVIYFQGTYAFLCDCDATEPADKIFQIKNRPREKGLSLVVDPEFLPDFVDLAHPAFEQFPLGKSIELQRSLHALGLVFPAGALAPADLVQNGTIMNVWTEYRPHRPLTQLTKLARAQGIRGFKGASTNLSHEPTYNTVEQVLAQFDGQIPLILDGVVPVPENRRKSTTLIDLTGERPTMIRAGNVTADEVQVALDQVDFGKLKIAANVKVL
ncbi:MAG: tRNA A37 threonylcarbamoyladenosine synthetase subunit TsaC/SUA5/YrdC [Cellvibrionaceae bacterium]|jgi:tRNA A37 threonylcarbamoyladenosine synthetase subunit TsaC/SUA5/YrdC